MSEQNIGGQHGGSAELELQGILGKLIGGALGGVIGTRVGGRTGGTVGRIAGSIAGSVLPFEAGPSAQAGQASSAQAGTGETPTDLEVQCFLSVSRKLNRMGGANLGTFQSGPGGADDAEPISELEMQGFGSFLKKVGRVAGKVVSTGGKILDAGKTLGVFQAGPSAPATQAAGSITDLEMQAFWKVARRCGHGYGPGTGINPRASIGMFQAGPGGEDIGDLEMQGFWEVVRKIGTVAGRVVDGGRAAKLFQADAQPPAQQAGADGIAQALATVQQALPAIQQLMAQQGQAPAGTHLN